jgi:N-acetylglucosaminyldiphosphoundecaprenol N-acetyl-beta-D-mannosaminyltransferase
MELIDLAAKLTRRFPGINIVGTYTPPFRPLTPGEEDDLREQLKASRAEILWSA